MIGLAREPDFFYPEIPDVPRTTFCGRALYYVVCVI